MSSEYMTDAARAAAEADDERILAEFQKRRAAEIAETREAQRRENEARRAERQREAEDVRRQREEAFGEIDDHHRNFGAFLKLGEAFVTQELHKWYQLKRSNPKVIRQLEKLIKLFQETRPVMDSERLNMLQARAPHALPAVAMEPGNDVYYGDELAQLQQSAYRVKTMRGVLRQYDWWHGDKEPTEEQGALENAISDVVNAARQQPWLPPETAPVALIPAASEPATIADRHVDLCVALIENPDQPQAAFVKQFRVHPNTVRHCRRELEEAGEIPVLAHRHGPARCVQLTEAAD